jgi:hypothetical protein
LENLYLQLPCRTRRRLIGGEAEEEDEFYMMRIRENTT